MNKERQTLATASDAGPRLARPGFERPVEHLHFDRRARVWFSHDGSEAVARRERAASGPVDEVSE